MCFGFKILNMFQGFVNKMTVIMKFAAMGPIDIPPWCNVFLGEYIVVLVVFRLLVVQT
jgi:hypothetical protein